MSTKLDLLLLVAEQREISFIIKKLSTKTQYFFTGTINNKKIGVYVTGVGKNSVKRSALKIQNMKLSAENVINVGNVGALGTLKKGTIVPIGKVLGENAKKQIILKNNPFSIITTKKFQKKSSLISSYPNIDMVDMELYYLIKSLPEFKIKSYKIVLDTFKNNPTGIVSKFTLPLLIQQNNKKLSAFIENLCETHS